MSKSQEQEQESIDNIRQQLDEEYKNLFRGFKLDI